MSAIIIMLVGSLIIAGGFLMAFLWSVKDGQYEDDYSPAQRMLFDDTINTNNNNNKTNQ